VIHRGRQLVRVLSAWKICAERWRNSGGETESCQFCQVYIIIAAKNPIDW
jgi:hypothetical protein